MLAADDKRVSPRCAFSEGYGSQAMWAEALYSVSMGWLVRNSLDLQFPPFQAEPE